MENTTISLTLIIALSLISQWVALRMGWPPILLYLLLGLGLGPVAQVVQPDLLLGDLLFPFVSLSVAIILFDGGLHLKFDQLGSLKSLVFRLCTIGAVTNAVICASLAHYILGFPWLLSFVVGAMLIVTGPTVIAPMLRQLRLNHNLSNALKWEGIVTDPYAAMVGIFFVNAIMYSAKAASVTHLVGHVVGCIGLGIIGGLLAAYILLKLIEKEAIPVAVEVPITVVFVLVTFVVCNHFQHESGLVAVTAMGMRMANQDRVNINKIIIFKSELQIILIPILFTLLAARLQWSEISQVNVQSALFLLATIFVARPIAIAVATAAQGIPLKEKIFLAFFAPRGIVSVAVTSLFALELHSVNYPYANAFLSTMILTILGTVVIYSLLSQVMTRLMDVRETDPNGVLIVGSNIFSRQLALLLEKFNVPVTLMDTDRQQVLEARMQDLEVRHVREISEGLVKQFDFRNKGILLAMTNSGAVNQLVCSIFKDQFTDGRRFSLECSRPSIFGPESLSERAGFTLFQEGVQYEYLVAHIEAGAQLKATRITKEFPVDKFIERFTQEAIPLFKMMDNHRLDPVNRQNMTLEGTDYTLISLILSNEITPILQDEVLNKNLFGVEPIKPGIQFTP
tara:strand:- start:669 stop:2540 length:1872 start_codon:yes stop_codon:yes gene_type:complete